MVESVEVFYVDPNFPDTENQIQYGLRRYVGFGDSNGGINR